MKTQSNTRKWEEAKQKKRCSENTWNYLFSEGFDMEGIERRTISTNYGKGKKGRADYELDVALGRM